MFEPNPINEGAFTFFLAGFLYAPYEYTGYKDEVLASKSSAYLTSSLNESPIYDVKGPDATKFLSSICVNNFANAKVGGIRHGIICNEKGQIMTDGVIMKIADDTYRTYWLLPVIDYLLQKSGMDVEGVNLTGQEFFFQIAGPKSLEILEKAADSDLHDIRFAHHRMAKIAGVDVRILRLGMAGTLAYEVHGDMSEANKVFGHIWEAGQEFGIKKLGRVAYVMNHTEAGFPNINMHYPLPWYEDADFAAYLNERPGAGFFNFNRKLIGSVGDDVESRFKTPYDVGWGKLVKFNHDFIGKEALLEISKNPKTTIVTLEWNPDDIADIFASQFKGKDVTPYESISERPVDVYFNLSLSNGFIYHADKVMADGKQIGTSTGRLNSVYYQRMISLGFIEKEYAVLGKELTLIWGTPGTPQKEVRVTVARFPYIDLENNKAVDVESIPSLAEK